MHGSWENITVRSTNVKTGPMPRQTYAVMLHTKQNRNTCILEANNAEPGNINVEDSSDNMHGLSFCQPEQILKVPIYKSTEPQHVNHQSSIITHQGPKKMVHE